MWITDGQTTGGWGIIAVLQASLTDFYEFFKSINECNDGENEDLDFSNESDENIDDDIENKINQPITESEILKM